MSGTALDSIKNQALPGSIADKKIISAFEDLESKCQATITNYF